MSERSQAITAEVLLKMKENDCRYELVKGALRKSPFADYVHGRTTVNIFGRMSADVKRKELGSVCGPNVGFSLSSGPDTVRAPDVAFIKQSTLDLVGDVEDYFPGAPDLAVEVNSITDTDSEVDEKVVDWLEAGARMVVVVGPRKRTVVVYRSFTEITVLTENDVFDGGDVVPGWSMPVRGIFE